MSVHVYSKVWDLKLPRDEKLVLLAYADHADEEGRNIYPSVARMAEKTGYQPRAIQYITRKLERGGLLVAAGSGPRGTRRWTIPIETFGSPASLQADAPRAEEPVCTPGVQADAPGGCTPVHPGGDIQRAEGVQALAPEPSFKPSLKPSVKPPAKPVTLFLPAGREEAEIFQTWSREIGPVTRAVRASILASLTAGEVPREWILQAIGVAASRRKHRWNYVDGILANWKLAGYPTLRKGSYENHSTTLHGTGAEDSPGQQAADRAAAGRISQMSRLRRGQLENPAAV